MALMIESLRETIVEFLAYSDPLNNRGGVHFATAHWRPAIPPTRLSLKVLTNFSVLGTCKNGTGAVGCGPQEEFRACADVTVTEEDGTADDTPNSLADDDRYVEGEEANEVDYEEGWNEEREREEEDKEQQEAVFESVIVVAIW